MKKQDNTLVWIVIAVLAVLFFSGFGMMGFPFGNMMFGYGFNFGFLFMALIAVALVLFIVWLIKELQGKK